MLFHDLNEDVVAEILSSCDVHTVLCVSRVNKHFRAIALEKQLWMLLLRRLAFQGFIDLAPEETFVTQTTSDLIDEVKCLIFGPKTWSPTWSSPPIPKRQIILPFKHERPLESRTHSITLLPGGRHFVFHDQASLRFFDAATGRVVCSYQHPASIQFWSYAMSGGGDETFVAMAGALNHTVDVLRVDFASALSETVGRVPLPTHRGYLSRPVILGDLLAISFEIGAQAPALVLLANWRSEQHVLLSCPPSFGRAGPILLPGHLGITYSALEAPRQQLLAIYSCASFAPLWRPTPGMSFWDRVYTRDLSPVACERLEFNNILIRQCLSLELSAHASPLHSNAHEILLHTVDLIPAPPTRSARTFILDKLGAKPPPPPPDIKRAVLFSFSFDVSRPALLRSISHASAGLHVRRGTLALSRYCVDRAFPMIIDALVGRRNAEARVMPDGKVGQRVILPYERACKDIYLAPHSGAVLVLTPGSFIITYYR